MKSPNINISLSDIKNMLGKLSVLKNNLSLLLPIVIALVGLLLIIPTRLLSARLRATVEKTSVKQSKDIDQLISQLSPKNLGKIVSPKYVEAVAQDACEWDRQIDQMGKRELLTYALFPDTTDQSQELFDQFKRQYQDGVAALIQGLRPGEAPTAADIQKVLADAPRPVDAMGNAAYNNTALGGMGGGNAGFAGIAQAFDSLTDPQRKMIDQLCLSRAREARVYASVSDVAGYTDWGQWTFDNRDKAYRDCWYWQLGYWVIQDVVATIQQMDSSAESVLAAPVKRLVNVGFVFRKAGMVNARAYGGAGTRESNRPAYAIAPPVKGGLTVPCSGRVCNADIDVIHFDLQVVVDAAQVIPFMQALCSAKEHKFSGDKGLDPPQTYKHNQIGILEVSMRQIESRDVNHMLYRYGDRPMVELELICEYVFNRTPSYERIKPPQARADLGDTSGGTATAAAPSPAPAAAPSAAPSATAGAKAKSKKAR